MANFDPEMVKKILAGGRAMVLVVCRSLRGQRRLPGSITGFQCSLCKAELQASPNGAASIKAGGYPMCSACGVALAEMKADQGRLAGILTTPECDAAIASGTAIHGDQIDLLRMAHPYRPSDDYPD